MSVQRQRQKVCENCSTRGPKSTFLEGKFCSQTCKFEAEGEDYLRDFKYSHKYCFTCGTRLKRVFRPSDQEIRAFSKDPKSGWILDAFIGFQESTEHADYGEKDFGEITGTGIVCGMCGNTSHSAQIDELREMDELVFLQRFLDNLEGFKDETLDQREIYYNILDGDSLELAIGRVLE